ncbi:MAG: class II fumarate hydratase [Desulfobacterales bacterium]|nr:class II fumarate hydratase [Desulfobacterales bacterium]
MKTRIEKDSMGEVAVPREAYYGAQTQRASINFPISNLRLPSLFIHSLALIKKMAAVVNLDLKLLEADIAEAIQQAAQEVMDGRWDNQFVVDVFQTGSGTSTNMNMNEVLATRANEIITGQKTGKSPVHPNDHVNLGQSSNDVIPSTIHLAAFTAMRTDLIPSLKGLQQALAAKAEEFNTIKKIGRTHLQDAVPMTLGQEFSGYAHQINQAIQRLVSVEARLGALALGGTAVGTGLNTHPDFAPKVIAKIASHTGMPFREAENHFEAQATMDTVVETSGILKTVAVSLVKIANDIRWLASGPRCGLGEITIPSLQPGSSIMPGKVNPVIPEAVVQVAAHVMGNDTTIMMGGQAGIFELNVMLPVMAYNLLQSIALLTSVSTVFVDKCVQGITANRDRCAEAVDKSLAIVTALVPHIGYDRAAEISKKAFETGKTVREVALADKVLPEDLLNRLLQ